ncbi:MAG: flavodoxin family protein [Oscillospiraceae bacterium]|nr:flavodoxin family protein [Oscillospiraceae bacterium]
MKVLLMNGSTHKNGCTYLALQEVSMTLNAEGIETEMVQMGGGSVRDCTGCNGCVGKGRCVFHDDMVNEIIVKAKAADGTEINFQYKHS